MSDSDKFESDPWEGFEPAPRVQPIDPGNYPCTVAEVKYVKASTGTEGVQIAFIMLDGKHKGQIVTRDIWVRGNLKDEAKAMAARDLQMLGFTGFKDIDNPPKVDPARKFIVTIRRDQDDPMGKPYCFNPM